MIRFFSRQTIASGFILAVMAFLPSVSSACQTPVYDIMGNVSHTEPCDEPVHTPPTPVADAEPGLTEPQQNALDYLVTTTDECVKASAAARNYCVSEKAKLDNLGRKIQEARAKVDAENAKEEKNEASIQEATKKLNEFITQQRAAITKYVEGCEKHLTACTNSCNNSVTMLTQARDREIPEDTIDPHERDQISSTQICERQKPLVADAKKLEEGLAALGVDVEKKRCETAAGEVCEGAGARGAGGVAGAAGAAGADAGAGTPDAGAGGGDVAAASPGAATGDAEKKKGSGGNADFSGVLSAAAGILTQAMTPPTTTPPAAMQPMELPADHCSRPENRNEMICMCQGAGWSLPQCRQGQAAESAQAMGGQITGGGGAKLETTANAGTDSLKLPNMPMVPNVPPPSEGAAAGPAGFGGFGGGGGGGINTGGNMRPSGPDRDDRPTGASISADILTGARGGGSAFAARAGSTAPRNPEGLPGYNLGLRPSGNPRPDDLNKFAPDMKPPTPPPRMLAGQVGAKSQAVNVRTADFKLHPASTVIWQPVSARYQSLTHTLEP